MVEKYFFYLDGFRNQLGSPTLQGIRRCRKTGNWISLTWKFQGELILQVDLANVSGPCSISGRWNKGRWVTSRVAIWRVEHAVCTKSHWEMWLWPQFPQGIWVCPRLGPNFSRLYWGEIPWHSWHIVWRETATCFFKLQNVIQVRICVCVRTHLAQGLRGMERTYDQTKFPRIWPGTPGDVPAPFFLHSASWTVGSFLFTDVLFSCISLDELISTLHFTRRTLVFNSLSTLLLPTLQLTGALRSPPQVFAFHLNLNRLDLLSTSTMWIPSQISRTLRPHHFGFNHRTRNRTNVCVWVRLLSGNKNCANYFTSSNPHDDIILSWFWHLIWKYIWHIFSDILFWHSIW
jgi:hypothetical protein